MTLLAIGWAAALVSAAKSVHRHLGFLRKLYVPSSVVAGAVALLIGPQVLGAASAALGGPALLEGGLVPEAVAEVWEALPGLLINVVFAGLFLGKRIPAPAQIVRLAGPQVALGQTLAWGQYVVGIVLALAVLGPVFGMHPAAGALIEIGLEGGHGTAAALTETFEEFGFSEGADLALGLATIGLVGGVLSGLAIINWAARSGRLDLDDEDGPDDATAEQMCEFDERETGEGEPAEEDTDPLSAHLGLIAIAIGLGWLLQQGLILIEGVTWARDDGLELMRHLPLFPLAMIGGLVLQVAIDRLGSHAPHMDRALVNRISGTSLDLIIVTAIGTLSLAVIGDNLVPLLLMAAAGMAWSIGAFLLLAPRMVRDYPYQRGLADFGQSTGMTVTGLLLVRMADPNNRANAMESFGYKQLLFEPFVGGGLFTALSVPLIAQLGPWPVLGITSALLATAMAVGLLYFGRRRSDATTTE
jgi:glutamate:Na+ symporter, ESS family